MEERIKLLKELIAYLKTLDITKISEIFSLLDQTDDIDLKKENDIYLYLLSFNELISTEYLERISSIKIENLLLKIGNTKYKDISTQNKIRINLFRNKFYETISLLEKETELNAAEKELLLTLTKMANKKETLERNQISFMVKNKQYNELIAFLDNIKEKRKLSLFEAYVYIIVTSIIRIKKTNKIPKVLDQNPEDMKRALMTYNFRRALYFNHKDLDLKFEESKYIINILLKEINSMIETIIENAKKQLEQEKLTINNSIKQIKKELSSGNIDSALELIKKHLKEQNNDSYLFLIEKLIKISLLTKDFAYKRVIDILSNPNYHFDIKFFYSEFHNSINRNDLEIAELYLDIIKHYQKEYQKDFSDEELEKIISMLEYNKEEKAFLLSELRNLEKDNEYIRIFKKIPHKRRKILIRIANDIKEISVCSVGIKEPKNLVIRRINPNLKTENEKEIMSEAFNFYINQEYNMAILLYMRLLTSMEYVNVKVCEMLGLSYLHLNEYKEALKYLKISKQFVKTFQANKNGIDKLIDLLEKDENEETKQKIADFLLRYDSEVVNFDIEKLEHIAEYMKENNMTIEEGIEKFELVPNQVLIIKLIYARYYYIEGMIVSGDQIVKEVEKTKQKTGPVIVMLNEIRENKQFYQNRKSTYTKKLAE